MPIDAVFLSRLQFALTAMFHILWPVLTIGLSQGDALGALLEGLSVMPSAPGFWSAPRLFIVIVALGVAFGYASLGATYLILKTEGGLQRHSFQLAKYSTWGMMSAAAVVIPWTLSVSDSGFTDPLCRRFAKPDARIHAGGHRSADPGHAGLQRLPVPGLQRQDQCR